MTESIVVEFWWHGSWQEVRRIEHDEITAYGLTAQHVADYLKQHPNPLDRLFVPAPVYRVLYRLEQQVARWV